MILEFTRLKIYDADGIYIKAKVEKFHLKSEFTVWRNFRR